MPRPAEVNDWIARAEIDYLGPFVSAWAAFNAWYRHVSGSRRDNEGLLHIRNRQNSLRGAVLPYLDSQTIDNAESAAFKQHIADLHGALEAHRLESDHNGNLEHISLRSVPLSRGQPLPQNSERAGRRYEVEKVSRVWISKVFDRAGTEICRIEQPAYGVLALTATPAFLALSQASQGQLRALYSDCNPRPMTNLLNGNDPAIQCGTINFRCPPQDLFSGVVITIYRMRNTLLHGELAPHSAALACYGPAYQLVRTMLNHCA
ncbi:hypothetical protein [Sphingorhabdus sp. SMR4y]|uniref:hypothetical protein n=1 Tax=Sphingorhabdus sp. SMR4y TaxID=2584094 RepID=UPI000B5DCB54|nr:hypothetical protein [Sphingorhabdus sp. SMR4y]ASK88360.1 hypothetical protein SPHFLASMR4Y_01612 [Sphingorhabdus sp. SMR4y]